jgi:hypothetical protein
MTMTARFGIDKFLRKTYAVTMATHASVCIRSDQENRGASCRIVSEMSATNNTGSNRINRD